jgi:hypothetical protein
VKLTYNDDQHAYWLDGRRCKSVTTVAKIPDDTYALEQWRKRMVAVGMAISPPLVERAAAHYDDRDQLDRIAEEAMVAAKSHEAAGRGTAAHRITERIDLGQTVIDTPLAQAVQEAWATALDAAGLEIIPEFVERIVVYPEHRIAGRFDRICRRQMDQQLMVVDLKTGDNAVRYPHSIAVQLAMYANAPLLAGPIPNGGGTTQTFESLPAELDRDTGIVIHMPAENRAEVVEIDIAAGQKAVEKIIFPALTWRARSDLVSRPAIGQGTVPEPSPPRPDRVEWIRGWIRCITDIDHLALIWPTDVALPKRADTWTDIDIDKIAAACTQVDAANGGTFWPPDPTHQPMEVKRP